MSGMLSLLMSDSSGSSLLVVNDACGSGSVSDGVIDLSNGVTLLSILSSDLASGVTD